MSELVVESRPDPQRGSVPPFQEVEVVLDWWPGEGHRYFRVRLRDGSEYVLRQDLASGAWRLDFFRDEGR